MPSPFPSRFGFGAGSQGVDIAIVVRMGLETGLERVTVAEVAQVLYEGERKRRRPEYSTDEARRPRRRPNGCGGKEGKV